MVAGITEHDVEQAVLAWLANTGWAVRHGAEIAPGEAAAERANYGQVVLEQRLRDALAPKLNFGELRMKDAEKLVEMVL